MARKIDKSKKKKIELGAPPIIKRQKEYTLGTSIKAASSSEKSISGLPLNLIINLLFHH